jgi:SAM-dependent methyltransferase
MRVGRIITVHLAMFDVDIPALIAVPERFGEQGQTASGMTLAEIAGLDPRLAGAVPQEEAWQRAGLDPGARLVDLDADARSWFSDLVRFWRTIPRDVDRTISPHDFMYERTPDLYWASGPTTVRQVRLAMLQTRKERIGSILDFGSGYGRILRAFKVAFPEADLTACDILEEAVDFCAETFGATPVYAADDPGETPLEGQFDLIWLGSLFTHLSAPRWTSLLDLLERVLAPEGLLLFTTQGRLIRDRIAERTWQDAYGRPIWENWGVTEEALDEAVADYEREGFAYLEWGLLERHYGTSVATPAWVLAQLQNRPGLRILGYRERAWGSQDLVTCTK